MEGPTTATFDLWLFFFFSLVGLPFFSFFFIFLHWFFLQFFVSLSSSFHYSVFSSSFFFPEFSPLFFFSSLILSSVLRLSLSFFTVRSSVHPSFFFSRFNEFGFFFNYFFFSLGSVNLATRGWRKKKRKSYTRYKYRAHK